MRTDEHRTTKPDRERDRRHQSFHGESPLIRVERLIVLGSIRAKYVPARVHRKGG